MTIPSIRPGDLPGEWLPYLLCLQRTVEGGSSTEFSAKIDLWLKDLNRIIRADGIAMLGARDGHLAILALQGGWTQNPEEVLRCIAPLAEQCIQMDASVRCDDSETDERVDAQACRNGGMRSILTVPLRSATGSSGVVVAISPYKAAFRTDQASLLELASSFLSKAGLGPETSPPQRSIDALPEDRYRQLVDGVTDHALFMLDLQGCVATWNPGAEKIFGYAPDEILGRNHALLFSEEDRQDGKPQFKCDRAEQNPAEQECWRLRKDGTRFQVVELTSCIRDAAGRCVGYAQFIRDLTEQRALENQLWHAQRMDAVGQLAGGIAHDFNNLLTIILGYTEILLDTIPPADSRHGFVDETRKAGLRATTLVRQLLAFSRQQILEPRVLDLNTVVDESSRMLQRLIGEDIQLTIVSERNLWPVSVDPGQIVQVLLNIAVNARDAMPTGGRLTIETANAELDGRFASILTNAKPGRYALMAITDTGVGMTREIQRHLFEPFFSTKPVGKGTGLGLATVYGIVRQSGGFVNVYSEPGHGSTFKIYIPAASADEGASASPATPSHALLQGAETVLLAEDDAGVRGVVAFELERFGYHLLLASSGAEAIALSQQYTGTIHLLVTDVVMPEIGGRELAETLQRQRPDLRVLFLSGYTDDAVVRHGVLQAQCNFLQKPFTSLNLATKVRQSLDRPLT